MGVKCFESVDKNGKKCYNIKYLCKGDDFVIDLHMHTSNSDGSDSTEELIKKAEKLKLKYISITDHDNCNAHKEIKEQNLEKLFSGKIITGIEIKCMYHKTRIEVLGYKFDLEKMNKWVKEFYKDKSKEQLQKKYFEKTYNACKQLGFTLTPKEEIEWNPKNDWASFTIYTDLKKYKQNEGVYAEDILNDFTTFNKKYCGDPNCILFIDKSEDSPTLEETIKVIKDCGGLVFMPHLFIYKAIKDKKAFIDDIITNYDVDGLECYHSEFSEDEIQYLLNLTKEKKMLRSGGSDYHGINKENIEMAVGKGNLKIEDSLVEDWI